MNNGLLGLFFAACISPCNAELVFDWQSNLSQSEKETIEEKVKFIAAKYRDAKYANYGVYDFINSKERHVIYLGRDNQPGYDLFYSQIHLRLMPSPLIDMQTFHEFYHHYADIMGRNYESMAECETEATKIEYLFMEEIKDKIPKKYYDKLRACIVNNDYWFAYNLRSPILKAWYYETVDEENKKKVQLILDNVVQTLDAVICIFEQSEK